jgi:peptidyl-prolyl cis-trans isomerase SurA
MKKKILMICLAGLAASAGFSQSLFTYGSHEVSKDEFIRAFNRNISQFENKEQSLKEYLQLYSIYKLKVAAAKESKLDTSAQLRYDLMNFRYRLENDYLPPISDILTKTGYKKNPAVVDEMLFLYADSAAYSKENKQYPIAGELIFSLGAKPVKGGDWLRFAKEYKLNKQLYKGESNRELLEKFIHTTATDYYREHLEEYNPDFKYQLQEFKEGNLFYEIMGRKVWNRSSADLTAVKQYYEANKDRFAWGESAEVILVNAKSYAYAEYALENMKQGEDWKKIAANSEGMIQGDSSRYELAQLPVKPGTALTEGAILEIVRNDANNSASFVKIIKLYPANMPRSFEEAKNLVINEYQQQLEGNWMKELLAKYPVKVNAAVFQSLLR